MATRNKGAAVVVSEELPAVATIRAFLESHRENIGDAPVGITELAKKFDISPRAIRFYEDKGLLEPQRINGGRAYTRRDQVRLSLILRGKAIGMSLAEVQHILELYGRQGEGKARQIDYLIKRIDEAAAELATRRAHIDETLAELAMIRSGLQGELSVAGAAVQR